jgi:Zn-dependent peptidase ImmA (M78 family)/transcriptional regulator with XRE-family HTH domain
MKLARQAAGLSTRAVAERLAPRHSVSHQTIANYEKAATQPTLPLLADLAAVYGKDLNWFLERGSVWTGVRYRHLKSKVRPADKQQFEQSAARWLNAYIRTEEYVGDRLKAEYELPGGNGLPKEVARKTRSLMGLDERAPVPSAIEVLEKFGVRVIEVDTEAAIDGMAGHLDGRACVVLKPSAAHDRTRLNAMHELFHLVLEHCARGPVIDYSAHDVKRTEDDAFEAASYFLMPESELEEAFRGRSMVRLVEYKKRYGISLAAMIYRAEKSGILKSTEAKWLWMQFAQRGWRTAEPGEVRADRATRFEQLVDGLVLNKNVTYEFVASIAGVEAVELQRRVDAVLGLDRVEERGDLPRPTGPRLAT